MTERSNATVTLNGFGEAFVEAIRDHSGKITLWVTLWDDCPRNGKT